MPGSDCNCYSTVLVEVRERRGGGGGGGRTLNAVMQDPIYRIQYFLPYSTVNSSNPC